MPLINCEISFQLKWSEDYILIAVTAANQESKFEITDTKLCLLTVTLSTQDNVKLLKQLETSFKIINWNKYQSNITNQALNRHLYLIINASFQGVN